MPIQDTADRFTSRMIIFLLEGILIGLTTYLWLEHAQMGRLYHWLFPIIAAALIVIFHGAFVETVYTFLKPPKRKLVHIWVISLVGIVFGFCLAYSAGICGIVCRILNSYCPVKWHTSPPETILVFFRTAWFPWLIATFFMTQSLLKKKIRKQGQTYQLFIDGMDGFLPASRHRASIFLPKLKSILNPDLAISG